MTLRTTNSTRFGFLLPLLVCAHHLCTAQPSKDLRHTLLQRHDSVVFWSDTFPESKIVVGYDSSYDGSIEQWRLAASTVYTDNGSKILINNVGSVEHPEAWIGTERVKVHRTYLFASFASNGKSSSCASDNHEYEKSLINLRTSAIVACRCWNTHAPHYVEAYDFGLQVIRLYDLSTNNWAIDRSLAKNNNIEYETVVGGEIRLIRSVGTKEGITDRYGKWIVRPNNWRFTRQDPYFMINGRWCFAAEVGELKTGAVDALDGKVYKEEFVTVGYHRWWYSSQDASCIDTWRIEQIKNYLPEKIRSIKVRLEIRDGVTGKTIYKRNHVLGVSLESGDVGSTQQFWLQEVICPSDRDRLDIQSEVLDVE